MVEVKELFYEDEENVWAFVCEEDRYCYILVNDISDSLTRRDECLDEKIAETYLNNIKLTILDKPHIEEACDVMQHMWHNTMSSEYCMYFFDEDELEYYTDKYNISDEELIEQIDNDIEKFNLHDVVEKDDIYTYVCYGLFMESFTGKR